MKTKEQVFIHEWDGGIVTWNCLIPGCYDPKFVRLGDDGVTMLTNHVGNAPYGMVQAHEQIDRHMEDHGKGKGWLMREMRKEIKREFKPKGVK